MGISDILKRCGDIAVDAAGDFLDKAKKAKKIFEKPAKTGFEKWDDDDVTPPFNIEKAKEEFAEKSFTDVYESIYRVSRGLSIRSNDILEDLDSRIHYLKGSPNIQAFWNSLFKGYENFTPEELKNNTFKFMEFVFAVGIKRDNSEQVTVDETTDDKYYNANDGDFVNGKKMKVDRAYWSLGDKILQKGVLTSL